MATDDKNNAPLYTISIASELVGTTDQTLRLYEKHGLIQPSRRNKNRFYSENDIQWLKCLRSLIHSKKISIEGIKRLLNYAPCWEILDCTVKEQCSAFQDRTKNCWEYNQMVCKRKQEEEGCDKCIVYMSHHRKKTHQLLP
jgi:MerR family transcriptional regulator/heat shock protein HspR